MLKKGLLVFLVFSQIFLVGLLGYHIYFIEGSNDIVTGIFDEPPSYSVCLDSNQPREPVKKYIKVKGCIKPALGYYKLKSSTDGMIDDVYVSIGSKVVKDQPLFKMVDQKKDIEVVKATAELAKSIAQLEYLKTPCPYALAIKEKEIDNASLKKIKEKKQFFLSNQLLSKSAISVLEREDQQLNFALSCNSLEILESEYRKIESGMTKKEKAVYEHDIEIKKADLLLKEFDLKRSIIRAPVEGKVVDIRVKKGECTFVSDNKAVVIASNKKQLEVFVKEADISLIELNSKLVGYAICSKNPKKRFPVHFSFSYPNLTNINNDKRLKVILSFGSVDFPLFLEQEFDVYLETLI